MVHWERIMESKKDCSNSNSKWKALLLRMSDMQRESTASSYSNHNSCHFHMGVRFPLLLWIVIRCFSWTLNSFYTEKSVWSSLSAPFRNLVGSMRVNLSLKSNRLNKNSKYIMIIIRWWRITIFTITGSGSSIFIIYAILLLYEKSFFLKQAKTYWIIDHRKWCQSLFPWCQYQPIWWEW